MRKARRYLLPLYLLLGACMPVASNDTASRAASAVEVPAPEVQTPPSDEELVSVIEDIAARKEEERRAPSPAMAPAIISSATVAEARPDVRPQVAEREDHEDISTRMGDVSQLAFAGLAVLGLAGLSVLAARNAP